MNKKGNKTTTGYIPWEEYQRLIQETTSDKIRLFAAISGYAGLRISDVLALRWKQLLGESIVLVEKKTGKTRTITINERLRDILNSYGSKTGYIFASGSGKPVSSSYMNRLLKKEFNRLDIKVDGNVSSHMFRKTLGRRFMEMSEDKTKALILLMDLFGHTSPDTTKRYLGIRQEEINNVYLSL